MREKLKFISVSKALFANNWLTNFGLGINESMNENSENNLSFSTANVSSD